MSLIPSESYSFPDHFTTTVTPSRKPKKEEPEPIPLETRQKRPSIVALPNPQPRPVPAPAAIRENSEPVRSKAPALNPALRRASASPPRIPEAPRKIALPATLKPKVRWNTRAPAMDPAPTVDNGAEQVRHEAPAARAQNVIPMKPVRVARPQRMMPPPESLVPQHPLPTVVPKRAPITENPRPVAAANPQADFFEMFAQGGEMALSKLHRKMKMRRFIVCESVAVAILLLLAILGLSRRPDNAALLWIMNILTIASFVVAALIPVLFFAFTPTLPEIER